MDWYTEFGVDINNERIYTKLRNREDEHDKENRKTLLIHGHVQSGKTRMSQTITLYNIMEHDAVCIHICRNITMDKIQYISRLNQYLSLNKLDNIIEVVDIQKLKSDKLKMKNVKDNKRIIILMANVTQIRNLSHYLTNYVPENKRLHLTIDESDTITIQTIPKKKQTCLFNNIFLKYYTRIIDVVYFTATIDLHVFKNDESQKLTTSDFISLNKPEVYYGFMDFENWNIIDDYEKRMSSINFNSVTDIIKQDMIPTLNRSVNSIIIPKLMYLYISSLIRDHDQIRKEIESGLTLSEIDQLTFVRHDRSEIQISYTYSHAKYNLLPDSKVDKYSVMYCEETNMITHTYKGGLTNISNILRMIKYDTHHTHRNIIFVSGRSDGRGISFNSEENEGLVYIGWNVVFMPRKTNMMNVLQVMGRQCGRYNEINVVKKNAKTYSQSSIRDDVIEYFKFLDIFLTSLKQVKTTILMSDFIEIMLMQQCKNINFPEKTKLWDDSVFGNIPFEKLPNGKLKYNSSYKKFILPLTEKHIVNIENKLFLIKNNYLTKTNEKMNMIMNMIDVYISKHDASLELNMFKKKFLNSVSFKTFIKSSYNCFIINDKTNTVLVHPQLLPFIVQHYHCNICFVNNYEKQLYDNFIISN